MCLLAGVPERMPAQGRTEWRVGALGMVTPEPFAGGTVGWTWWDRQRTGGGVNVALGWGQGEPGARAEGWLAFHLDPFRSRGAGVYAGAGGAFALVGGTTAGYVMLVLGVEATPGRARGWYAEAGVGGGTRIAAGYRLGRVRRP